MVLHDAKLQEELLPTRGTKEFSGRIYPQNSLTFCTTLTLFGSVEQAGFFFLAPVCGGRLTRTFHFRMSSDSWRRDGTTSLELTVTELLPASLVVSTEVLTISLSLLVVVVVIF